MTIFSTWISCGIFSKRTRFNQASKKDSKWLLPKTILAMCVLCLRRVYLLFFPRRRTKRTRELCSFVPSRTHLGRLFPDKLAGRTERADAISWTLLRPRIWKREKTGRIEMCDLMYSRFNALMQCVTILSESWNLNNATIAARLGFDRQFNLTPLLDYYNIIIHTVAICFGNMDLSLSSLLWTSSRRIVRYFIQITEQLQQF